MNIRQRRSWAHWFAPRILFIWSTSVIWGLGSMHRSLADEGMWLFNDLPKKSLQETHGFTPSDEWLKHVMLSSVRFNSGGSASFVSSTGLVITNHHVASDTLHKISTAENDYLKDGFIAKSLADEVPAPDLELNQLVSIEDVTERVKKAVSKDLSTADAFKARMAVMANIEKESLDATGFRSDVITLFGGARYHLYRYKKYTDVRVVWAPEAAIAAFGGDADNFEYPRYCLDVSIFRAYENGKPAKIDHYLKWSPRGAGKDELVFVSGNPGRTQRSFTVAALKYLRDYRLPYMLDYLRRREIALQQFGLESEETERRARDERHGIENSRKAYVGMLQGLQEPSFFVRRESMEKELRAQVASRPELKPLEEAWTTIEETAKQRRELLGMSASFSADLYAAAEQVFYLVNEDQKPSSERLREYRDSARESLEQQLFSPAPIYDDLERANLADAIARMVEKRGGDDPLVIKVLAGKGPKERAAELVAGTKMKDPAVRRELVKGGVSAVNGSNDAMLQLVRTMEDEFRRLRKLTDELDELDRQAYAKINEATIAIKGTSGYPDATFTLRLAFGTVKGYQEEGKEIPPWTTFGGALEHEKVHRQRAPWKFPDSWELAFASNKLSLNTPFDFVCTADIIGGNSGSPVINKQGEFVGIIFDGNIQSLTSDFIYSDEMGRAVSVHSSAIQEALRNVYGAESIANELGR
jgi:Peptidase S46